MSEEHPVKDLKVSDSNARLLYMLIQIYEKGLSPQEVELYSMARFSIEFMKFKSWLQYKGYKLND